MRQTTKNLIERLLPYPNLILTRLDHVCQFHFIDVRFR